MRRDGRELLRHALIGLLALAQLLAGPNVVLAQGGAVVFAANPASVQLAPNMPARVDLTIGNSTDAPISDLVVSHFSSTGVKVDFIDSPEIDRVDPGQTVAVSVSLSSENPTVSGPVHFRADWKGATPGVAVVTLEISSAAEPSFESVVTAKAVIASDSVSHERPTVLSVLLSNQSSQTVRVRLGLVKLSDVTLSDPTTVGGSTSKCDPSPGEASCLRVELESGSSTTLNYAVTATRRVAPGGRNLLVRAEATWKADGIDLRASTVLSASVTVGVFGESEIAKVLGLPFLLLIPGFAALAGYAVLRRLLDGWSRRPLGISTSSWAPLLKANTPEYWLIVLALTALILGGWWLVWRDNLIQGYGVVDLMLLAATGAAGGMVAALISASVIRTRSKKQQTDLDRVTPKTGDTPMEFLEKLGARKHATLMLPIVRNAEGTELGCLLYPELLRGERVWVGSKIQIPLGSDRDTAVLEALESESGDGSLTELLVALRRAPEPVPTWAGSFPHPIPTEGLQLTTQQRFVEPQG